MAPNSIPAEGGRKVSAIVQLFSDSWAVLGTKIASKSGQNLDFGGCLGDQNHLEDRPNLDLEALGFN